MRRTLTLTSIAALVFVAPIAFVAACSGDDTAASPGEVDTEPLHDGATSTGEDAPVTGDDSNPDDDSGLESDGALVGAGCVLDSDCDGGRCGYSTLAGCAATGICVTPNVPLVDGAPLVACGCDGANVTFVTGDLTSGPVSSLSPCADAGPSEAGSTDAPSEAAPNDAGDDSG